LTILLLIKGRIQYFQFAQYTMAGHENYIAFPSLEDSRCEEKRSMMRSIGSDMEPERDFILYVLYYYVTNNQPVSQLLNITF
jgi:hypothetical protein